MDKATFSNIPTSVNASNGVSQCDHHWENTLAKRKEIIDTTNHSSPIVSKDPDDIFAKKTPTATINSTLSENDVIDEQNITDEKKENLVTNIIDELLFKLVECSPKQVFKQNISNGPEDEFIPVLKGVKKANFKQYQESFKTSNKFSALEIEPTLEEIGDDTKENFAASEPSHKKSDKGYKGVHKRQTSMSKYISPVKPKSGVQNPVDRASKCPKCFISHFPLPKFCRWSTEKPLKISSVTPPSVDISDDTMILVKEKIHNLQSGLKSEKNDGVLDSFFKRSENATDPFICPDLIGENSYSKKCNLKLKGGGTENLKVKRFTSESKAINTALNSFRSSSMLDSFGKHKKCPPGMFCNFCLLRSIILRINLPKGRQAIIPLEVECQSFITEKITEIEVLSSVLENACNSFPAFADAIKPQWKCLCCKNTKSNDVETIITLDSAGKNREISDLFIYSFK